MRGRLVALVLVAIVLVVYAPIVLGGWTWDDARYHTEIAPPRIAAADAVLHGELPAWWEGSALGVPLLGEPSHGAAYLPTWLAGTPRSLDLLAILHVLWCALGIAWCSRRLGASELGSVVAGGLVATSALVVGAALRGVLPAVAHLPWLALAVVQLRAARSRRRRAAAVIAAAVWLALIGLAGQFVMLVDAAALLVLGGLNRQGAKAPRSEGDQDRSQPTPTSASPRLGGSNLWSAVALAAGVAIASVQWLPAMIIRDEIVGGPLVPASTDVLVALAVGAPAFVLAAIAVPSWRAALAAAALVALAILVDAHQLALLALLAAAYAGRGFDRIIARVRKLPLQLAVVVVVLAPGVIALPLVHPMTDRELVAEPAAFARAALEKSTAWPRRVYRPVMTFPGQRDPGDRSLTDRIATLGGTSAAKWGVGAARSEDAARPRVHDRVWAAAAAAGGALLSRYSIALAILPISMAADGTFHELARRMPWALVEYPASPAVALVHEWIFAPDVDTALARMFPPGSDRGLAAGVVVLSGQGAQQQDEPGPPVPCKLLRWDAGAIDAECTSDRAAYAVVSSTAARGWSVTVDDRFTPWLVADVMRRAVPVTPGTHRIAWRYAAPGLTIALVLAALGIAVLIALWLLHGRHRADRDRAPDPDRPDVN